MIELRIVPGIPPPGEMVLMRCEEKVKSQDKEYQCILYKGHFGVHKFEQPETPRES
jgi:hypothetical protein